MPPHPQQDAAAPVNRRAIAVAIVTVLALVSGLVALVALVSSPAPPPPQPSDGRATTVPSFGIPAGIVAETIGTTTIAPHDPTAHPAPLAEPAQRRVWWAGDRWWAVLPDPESLGWRLMAASSPDGPWAARDLIDDRRRIALDVAVSDTELLVVAAGAGGERDRLVARRYRLVDGAYALIGDSPIQVAPTGVRQLAVEYAPDGDAWISYVVDGRLQVVRGPQGGASWATPEVLAGASETLEPTLAALVGTDDGVALAWTAAGADRLWIQRRTGDGWQETSIDVGGTVTASLSVAPIPGSTDVLALVGITTTGAGQSPSMVLVRAAADGRASVALVARDADRLRAPVLTLAPDAAAAVVFATVRSASGSDAVVVKAAPLDTLAFPSGAGARVLGGTTGDSVRAPLAPVLASPSGEIVVVGVRELPSELRAVTVLIGGGTPSEAPEPLPEAVVVGLVRQEFDVSAVGRPPSGWTRPARAAAGTFRVTGGSDERFVRLASTRRETARACLEFRGITSGELVARMDLRVNRPGTADAWVAFRGRGDAAVILFDDDRTLAYRSGDAKVSTGKRYTLGRWYRWEVRVDVTAGRYGWTLSRDGTIVTEISDVPWRMTDPSPVDTVCMEVPAGPRIPSLDMDGLSIDHLAVPPR